MSRHSRIVGFRLGVSDVGTFCKVRRRRWNDQVNNRVGGWNSWVYCNLSNASMERVIRAMRQISKG